MVHHDIVHIVGVITPLGAVTTVTMLDIRVTCATLVLVIVYGILATENKCLKPVP